MDTSMAAMFGGWRMAPSGLIQTQAQNSCCCPRGKEVLSFNGFCHVHDGWIRQGRIWTTWFQLPEQVWCRASHEPVQAETGRKFDKNETWLSLHRKQQKIIYSVRLKAQTNPLSYGSTPTLSLLICKIFSFLLTMYGTLLFLCQNHAAL